MPLINIVIALIVVGVALWLINNYHPMAGSIKTILNVVVVVAVAVWVLQAVGMWGRITSYKFELMSACERGLNDRYLVWSYCVQFRLQAWLQPVDSFDLKSKLRFHAESVYSPGRWLDPLHTREFLQAIGAPEEWGQGGNAYGEARRFYPSATTAIYARSRFRARFDAAPGPEVLSIAQHGLLAQNGPCAPRHNPDAHGLAAARHCPTWRLGSAYGAAFLSNQWYPDRLNTVRLGVAQGSLQARIRFRQRISAPSSCRISKERYARRNHD